MRSLPPPFPRSLRSAPRRPARRRWLAAALATALLPLILLWRVDAVDVHGCPGLPAAEVSSLEALAGTPVALLRLEQVRRRVQAWPGIGAVEVRLEPPATLRVTAHAARVVGSLRVGRRWHAVGADGRLGRPLEHPSPPVLEGFATSTEELRAALAVAERLSSEVGVAAVHVRRMMPGDIEVVLGRTEEEPISTVHVAPAATAAERAWCALVRSGEIGIGGRADLRASGRLVVGGRG